MSSVEKRIDSDTRLTDEVLARCERGCYIGLARGDMGLVVGVLDAALLDRGGAAVVHVWGLLGELVS